MSWRNYLRACQGLIDELAQSISPEDIDGLRESLHGTSVQDWVIWFEKNYKQIRIFASSTPSERKKSKVLNGDLTRPQLVMAAIFHLQCGYNLLRELQENTFEVGGSYRCRADEAAEIFHNLWAMQIPHWPFGPPNPFVDDFDES